MKEIIKINADIRSRTGTGMSRESRNNAKIPGIIYGEKKDPIPISIDEKNLKAQISDSGFFSRQCEIQLADESFKVLPKDIQLHPVKENILHIDFLRVGENTTVTLFVPVKFINENECEGIKLGGVLNIVRHEVELKSPVSKIPEFLEANLSGLEIGDSIHISSIKLDEGVKTTIQDRDFTIATVAPPTVMKVEESTQEVASGEGGTEKETESSEGQQVKEEEKAQGNSETEKKDS
jgi:large subunit ribosomal protein L25